MVVDPKCEIQLKAARPRIYLEPDECNTQGEHLRSKRLCRGQSQPQVALVLGVETDTVANWELGRNKLQVHYVPRIIEYLGYTSLWFSRNKFRKEGATMSLCEWFNTKGIC